MVVFIAIAPEILVILGIVLILHLPVWAVITIVIMVLFALMGSLAICAAIASKMAPKVVHPSAYRPGYELYDAQATEVSRSPETYQVAPRKTYKRMIGRRAVEYDAVAHKPVDPDQTNTFWRIKDNG